MADAGSRRSELCDDGVLEVALAGSHEASGFRLLFAVGPGLLKEKFLASCSRHYLAVPVHHIKNVKSLHQNEADYTLVVHMHKLGQSLLLGDVPDMPLATGLGSTGRALLTIGIYIVWLSLTYHGGKVSSMYHWDGDRYVSAETVLKYLDSAKFLKGSMLQ